MRICIVSCEHPPFCGGGIGTYSATISRFLAEAGHDVHVITNVWAGFPSSNNGSAKAPTSPDNLHLHRIDAFTNDYAPRPPHDMTDDVLGRVCREWESSLYWSILVADKLEQIHREHDIEVVEYPEAFADGYIALRRRKLGLGRLDVPMTVTLHGPLDVVCEYNLLPKRPAWVQRRIAMEQYCIRHADMLSSPSTLLADMVRQGLRLDPERHPCEVIHNPLDFTAFPPPPAASPNSAHVDSPSLLFVGRIEPRKGVKVLVDAAVKVMAENQRLTVHFLGRDCSSGEASCSMMELLLQRIPLELQDRFVFEGLVPRSEVLARYAQATACVFPAPWDNFPYVCVEAMASGACVIVSHRGGMAEMVEHDRSGLVFPAGDADSLAEIIRRILREPQLVHELQKNAPARISSLCSPEVVIPQRVRHYERTIERYRGKKRPAPVVSQGLSVAVLLPNTCDVPMLRQSIDSVKASARAARIAVDISIVGDRYSPDRNGELKDTRLMRSAGEGDCSSVPMWLDHVARLRPDFLLTLHPGNTVDEEYLTMTARVLAQHPKAAWATTWARSVGGGDGCYAGFDFEVPLEMLHYHPVPMALIRRRAFDEVGGWNLELAGGWRQWDLWLALHQAGWSGLVVPAWHAEYRAGTRCFLDVSHYDRAAELILDAVIRRNRRLFAEHGSELWITALVGESKTGTVNHQHDEPPGVRGSLAMLAKSTRKWVVRRLPRSRADR